MGARSVDGGASLPVADAFPTTAVAAAVSTAAVASAIDASPTTAVVAAVNTASSSPPSMKVASVLPPSRRRHPSRLRLASISHLVSTSFASAVSPTSESRLQLASISIPSRIRLTSVSHLHLGGEGGGGKGGGGEGGGGDSCGGEGAHVTQYRRRSRRSCGGGWQRLFQREDEDPRQEQVSPRNETVHAAGPGTRNQTPNPGSNAARAVHHRVNPNPNVEHRKRSSTAEVERAAQEVVETAARCVLL